MFKSVLVILACTAAFAAGNPAAGTEWRWKSRDATVSPNIMGLPFAKIVETFSPTVFIPGTKAVEGCGMPAIAQSRIVGGAEAIPHSHPWQVALFIDDAYFCGGSIISDEWIMTAAHCMDGALSVEVVAGAHNIREVEASQVSQFSTNFFTHENYAPAVIRNDIAMIKLATPLVWTDEIAPVCLPARSTPDLPDREPVQISGWGKTSDASFGISDVLMEIDVPIDEHDDCAAYYGDIIVSDYIVCIDSTGGRGSCNGDSGGPLTHVDDAVNIRGIVSFGSSAGCESGAPDAFTRVTRYLDWIETNTGIIVDA